MVRTHRAEHGRLVFDNALTRRQKIVRGRLTALAAIAAMAASAGLLQHFNDSSTPSGPPAPSSGVYSAAR